MDKFHRKTTSLLQMVLGREPTIIWDQVSVAKRFRAAYDQIRHGHLRLKLFEWVWQPFRFSCAIRDTGFTYFTGHYTLPSRTWAILYFTDFNLLRGAHTSGSSLARAGSVTPSTAATGLGTSAPSWPVTPETWPIKIKNSIKLAQVFQNLAVLFFVDCPKGIKGSQAEHEH